MATIGSLTLGTPTPNDYMVIENGNGNFKLQALPVVSTYDDPVPGGSIASVTLDTILLTHYNRIVSRYGKRPGHYAITQAWGAHSGGIQIMLDCALYQGQYPYMYGTAIMQTGGVYAFVMTPTSASDPTPIIKKAQLATDLT